MKLLVIGKSSFIAKQFIDFCERKKIEYLAISHSDFSGNLDGFSWVINFSLNPRFFVDGYSTGIDQDALIASEVSKVNGVKFAMVSSRTVYGSEAKLSRYTEHDPSNELANSNYGRNKIYSEQFCESVMGSDSLLILRGSNIFGYEVGRRSFMGMAMATLLESSQISLDVSGKTVRDFIPVTFFVESLAFLIARGESGVFNVGAGFGVTLEEFCAALISGYGRGNIVTNRAAVKKDQFVLDTRKLIAAGGTEIDKNQVMSYAASMGRKLRDEQRGVKVNV